MDTQPNEFEKKIEAVKAGLKSLEKVLVAFSGGKDSFFLLKTAVETLGKENVYACRVQTGFSTKNDRKRIDYFTRKLDFQLVRLEIDLSREKIIMSNPRERCYYCKKKIFTTIKEKAAELGVKWVVDGTTVSDLSEYRPGLKALEELHILSPLRDARITSREIVAFLKENMGIEDYFLTSSACLATRFPYDTDLSETLLRTFDDLEEYFVAMGIYPVKIRFIPEGIRIETPARHFQDLFNNREKVVQYCRDKGIKFVTLDLEGIKSGVWD